MSLTDVTVQERGRARCLRLVRIHLGALALAAGVVHAQGTPAANPYDQTRTSAFTYFGPSDGAKNGLLKSEIVEPLTSQTPNAQLCVVTTYDYDAYGNKTTASTANCAGASGNAAFTTRGSSSAFAAQAVTVSGISVNIPAGTFATTSTNALSQSETHTYDPRFGAMLTLTGPNSLTTNWVVDDLGRKTTEIRADGTRTVNLHCFIAGRVTDTSSNSPGCTALSLNSAEVPVDAVAYVHSEPRDASNGKNGPFARVYTDRAGRKLRSVTEAFDGANQPGGASRLIVQDTDYNVYGVQTVVTQPYFLDSGSSLASGSTPYGMSMTVVDLLGRPTAIYSTDAATTNGTSGSLGGSQPGVVFGARRTSQAAVTTISYSGLTTITNNDKGQTRTEEKNIDGKLVRATDALGAQIAYQHDAFGNLVVTKDALQNQLVVRYDARGRKVAMTDPDTGLWEYDYDALGQLVWQRSANQRALGQTTTMAYDTLGRMTSRTEPEYVSSWRYDSYADGSLCMQGGAANRGAGKLCESNTSSGINRKVLYDNLGRPLNTRTSISNGPSFGSAVGYDASGRLTSQTYPSGLQVSYSYTAKGFLNSLNLATAATVTPLPATPGGTPAAGITFTAGKALWTAGAYNAWGQAERQTYGNDVITATAFEGLTGRPISATAGLGAATNVLNQGFVWDSLGHLTAHSDANGDGNTGAVTDAFSYDALGRLTNYAVSAPAIPNLSRSVALQYNALGMLLYKSDVGNFSYGAQNTAGVKPHALVSVAGATSASYTSDANGNVTAATNGAYRAIAYTSFNLPDNNTGARGPAGSPQYGWQYDENHQRIKETHAAGGATRTTWYLHPDNQGGLGFESESSTASPTPMNRHYLTVGGSAIGVLVTNAALPVLASGQMAPAALGSVTLVKVEYWHKDHLGSLIATTDHAGAVTARYAYDPFGKRRSTTGTYDSFGTLIVDWTTNTNNGTDRGYTGHEHLDDIGIVHMNGRLFDPTLGRFMQGDPLIQDAGNLQNYNRFGYCYNNPLTCSDPSGYGFASFLKWADPLGYAGHKFMSHSWIGRAQIQVEITVGSAWCGNWAAACYGAGQATYASLSGASDSQALRTGLISGAAYYAGGQSGGNWAAGALIGCVSSYASGGSCRSGAVSGAFSSAFGPDGTDYSTSGALQAAFVGGVGSVLGGGKFRDGAATGAFSYMAGPARPSAAKDGDAGSTQFPDVVTACDGDNCPMPSGRGSFAPGAFQAKADNEFAAAINRLFNQIGDAVNDAYDYIIESAIGNYRTRALKAYGISPEDASGIEIHHIVPWDSAAASPARVLLKLNGIEANDLANLMPISKADHNLTQTGSYITGVNTAIAAAAPGGKNAIILQLNYIRVSIYVKGTFP